MLAAIDLILIIKQIPHATGYHTSYEGDESYMRKTAESSFWKFLVRLTQSLWARLSSVRLLYRF